MILIAALLTSLAIGFALTRLLSPHTGAGLPDVMLTLSLAITSGLGLSSLLIFICLAFANGNVKGESISAVVLALVLVGLAWIRNRSGQSPPTPWPPAPRMPWLAAAFCLAALAAAATFILLTLHSPYGSGWDALDSYNQHARFMFLGREHWKDVFSAMEVGWSPGYPPLTAGAIAHCWFFVGRESLVVPSAIGFLFSVAVVGLLASSLCLLRSASQGLIAGIVLLCSPKFVEEAARQYADVPLAAFYLGAVLLLCLHDALQSGSGWLVMSGMTAGMAAWTKPEGLMFVAVLVLARFVVIGVSRGLRAWAREFVPFCLGLLPVLTVVLYFKFRVVGAPSDLVVGQTPHAFLTRLLTVSRYFVIAKAFAKQLIGFGDWAVTLSPLLLMYLLVTGIRRARKDRLAIYTASLTLLLVMSGYFMVYVLTPHDLAWHLNTSLDRLVMQIWPLALFTFFMLARTPEEVSTWSAVSESCSPSQAAAVPLMSK